MPKDLGVKGGSLAGAKGKKTKSIPKAVVGKKRRAPDEDEVDYSAGDEGMVGDISDDGYSPPPEVAKKDKRAKQDKRAPKGEAMSFGDAMRTALGRHVPSTAQTPILAGVKKNKELEKERQANKKEKEETKLVEAKKKWFAKERTIPDLADGNFEKLLMKIATKGTVQLFNAVQKQQKIRGEERGTAPSGKAPDAMTKNQFLDMLKGKVGEVTTKKRDDAGDDDEEEGSEGQESSGDDDGDDDDDDDEGEIEFEDEEGEEEGESEEELEEDSEVEWE